MDRMNLSAKNNWIDEEGRVYIIFNDNILALFSADERQD